MKRWTMGVFALVVVAGMGVSWGAYRAASGAPRLSRYVPSGALLYLEAQDFSGLLAEWNGSREKQRWLKSGNYEDFSRSRLFLRLADANTEFAKAAGVPTDARFLQQVAGQESALAIFDIGKLEMLYITRVSSASATESALWQTRGKFETRSAGGVTFYLRRDAESEREVAFAIAGDYLVLATRGELLAGALQLLANDGKPAAREAGGEANGSAPTTEKPQATQAANAGQTVKSIETEAWWVQAVAAAGSAGELRMVLNLEKIVPSPYFRSYWIQKNVTEMKQYSAAVSDLVRSGNEYREERVLLRKTAMAGDRDVGEGPSAVAEIARLVPPEAGVYAAKANPSATDTLALLESRILAPHLGAAPTAKAAPQVELGGGETGSSDDLETRIDQAPVTDIATDDGEAALKQLLARNAILAVLHVESTEEDRGGVFVRIHSGVALLGQSAWDEVAVRSALTESVRSSLTAGNLGMEWQEGSGAWALNGLWPLQLAVHGKYLLLANDAGLLQSMLAQAEKKSTQAPADYLAGFDHARERGNFVRLTAMLDEPAGGKEAAVAEAGDGEAGDARAFFSGNVASLSWTLAGVTSETVAVHAAGDRVKETVTYRWAR
jgi:hypothetical protein